MEGIKKSANSADAHRKAIHRELTRNKQKQYSPRQIFLIKSNTRSLKKEIQDLEERGTNTGLSEEEQERLRSNKQELSEAYHEKDGYLKYHPEHRKFVYRHEKDKRNVGKGKQREDRKDPRRSIYYDEKFNPLGAPPPGMAYVEKSKKQWDAEQKAEFEQIFGALDCEEDSESDDEEVIDSISMPKKRKHADTENGAESDDSDGIIMPSGPPPHAPVNANAAGLTSPSTIPFHPPLPPGPPPPFAFRHSRTQNLSSPAPSHQNVGQFTDHPGDSGNLRQYNSHGSQSNIPSLQHTPTRPPGSPPSKPSAVISAEPVLRDLRKEATTFVPTALRKRQAAAKSQAAKSGLPSAVNAAPETDSVEEDHNVPEKISLVDTFQSNIAKKIPDQPAKKDPSQANDDYQKFLGDIQDLL